MALQQLEWQEFFIDCGIPDEDAKTYSETFAKNRIQGVEDLSKELLHETLASQLEEMYWPFSE